MKRETPFSVWQLKSTKPVENKLWSALFWSPSSYHYKKAYSILYQQVVVPERDKSEQDSDQLEITRANNNTTNQSALISSYKQTPFIFNIKLSHIPTEGQS